jgi:hypothetical protein
MRKRKSKCPFADDMTLCIENPKSPPIIAFRTNK